MTCKDGQIPDGPICPVCGGKRGPSGIGGGTWVHIIDKPAPYVVCLHLATGRAFTLNREYGLVDLCLTDQKKPKNYVSFWDGWLPTMKAQRPEWIEGLSKDEFTAYWMR